MADILIKGIELPRYCYYIGGQQMSDILIKGMKMPTDDILRIEICPNGQVNRIIGWAISEQNKGKAIELPPHGRLGDLDRVRERLGDDTFICYACRRLLDDVFDTAPTILEAST